MKKIFLLIIIFLFNLFFYSHGQITESELSFNKKQSEQNLAELCKVWGMIKYFHPALLSNQINWDSALVETIPLMEVAGDRQEYITALNYLLSKLNDPSTRIIDMKSEKKNEINNKEDWLPKFEWLSDSVALISITNLENFFGFTEGVKVFQDSLPKYINASAMIIDVRRLPQASNIITRVYPYYYFFSRISKQLFNGEIELPGEQFRYHFGSYDQAISDANFYYDGILIRNQTKILSETNNKIPPICFVVNSDDAGILTRISAMQKAGKAVVLSTNPLLTNSQNVEYSYELSYNLILKMKIGELVYSDGSKGFSPDKQININSKSTVIKEAINLLKEFKPGKNYSKQNETRAYLTYKDDKYEDMHYPSYEYRLLALFRYWNAIEYFFPYKDIMDQHWDTTLMEFIPIFGKAKDSAEYIESVLKLRSRINDSHAGVSGKLISSYFGDYIPPIKIKYVEGKTIVTDLFSDSLKNYSRIKIGDILLSIDGVATKLKREELGPLMAASNNKVLNRNIDYMLLLGQKGSNVNLEFSSGEEKYLLELERESSLSQWFKVSESKKKWEVLENNIGYIDLANIKTDDVDEAWSDIKNSKSIIVDVRGYPDGTVFQFAPKLINKPVKTAKFFGPVFIQPDSLELEYKYFNTVLQPQATQKYTGKIVLLVNENTQSHAEFSCMILQACGDVTVIGSQTAGADGNVTQLYMPGGIRMTFTGLAALYPDGRQTQRIGIIPDIEIEPTIKGIKEGIDEVLDFAIKYLSNNH